MVHCHWWDYSQARISNSSLHDNDVEADDNDVAAFDARKNGDPTSVASELLRHSSNITLQPYDEIRVVVSR